MFRAAVLSLLLAHSEPCETEALSAAPCQRKFGGPAAAGAGCCQALLGRDEGVDASSFLQMGLSLALRPGSRMAGDFSQPGEHRLDRLAELRDTERKLLLQLALAPGRAAAEAEESAERKQAEVEANTIEREVAMLEARISELSRLRDSLRTGKALLLEAAKPNVTHATAARSGQASATAVLSPPAPAAANRPQSAKATTLHIARNASQSASKAAGQASAKAVPNPSTQAAAKRMQSTKATTVHVAGNISQSASKAASQASLYRYAASGNATPGDAQNASLNASQNDSLNASQNASLNTSLNASDAAGQASEAAGQALDRAAAAGGRGANSTTAAAAAAAATTAEAISSTTTTATSVAASATTTEASAVATNVTSTEAGGGAAWTNTSTSGSGGGASTTATLAWDQGDRRDTVGMTPTLRSRGVVSAVIFIVVVLAVIASLIFLVLFRRAEP